jgi:hypothetical protein
MRAWSVVNCQSILVLRSFLLFAHEAVSIRENRDREYVSHFFQEALRLLPAHWKIRCEKADSGFFAQDLLGFLEQRALPYLVVAKLSRCNNVSVN